MKKFLSVFAIAFLISCKPTKAETKYLEIKDVSNISEIEFSTLADFEKFAVGDIFFCKKTSKAYVLVGGTYYSYNLNGYKTIADLKSGSEYKNAADYYEAAEQKIPDAEHFYFYKENKFKTGSDALDAFENGYAIEFNRKNVLVFENEEIWLDNPISNSYYKARELGINNLSDYTEHLFLQKHGFDTMATYEIAKSKGFKENADYKAATEKGFETKDDWSKAKSLSLETAQEYKDYNAFIKEIEKNVEAKKFSKQECVVYHYLAKVPKDSYSITKLTENVREQMNNENKNLKATVERYIDGRTLERSRYSSYSQMENYVSSNNITKKIINESKELGKYNEKTDVFNKR